MIRRKYLVPLMTLLLIFSAQFVSAQIVLPPGPLTQSSTPSVTVTLTNTPTVISFNVAFSGVPSGQSITNGNYAGWCPDFYGDYTNNSPTTAYFPYSTYDSNLPANAQHPNWDKVNWVLNHKPAGYPGGNTTWVVQQTIWRLMANQYAPAPAYPLPQPATDNLYNDALTLGAGFLPAGGQTIGVLLYIDGINPTPAQDGRPDNGQPNHFQEILIEVSVPADPLQTVTQGGWHAQPRGNNPGTILNAYFDRIAPLPVKIGVGSPCFQLTFTTADAIRAFLPAGGTPGKLAASATDPTTSAAGVFAGQVLALQLNVSVSNAGLGSYVLTKGPAAGKTVNQVLYEANHALGCNPYSLPSYAPSISNLNDIVTSINEMFD